MQVLGLLTTIIGIGAVALHYIVKVRAAEDGVSIATPFKVTDLRNIRTVVNQLLLLMSVATAMTGFADLSAISLCFTYIIPLQTAVTIGFALAGAFVLGSALSGLDIMLAVRGSKTKATIEKRDGES